MRGILTCFALLAAGCSYTRVSIDCRVQTQITPVVPVVVAAKIDLCK